MRLLPLYDGPMISPVEAESPLSLDTGCTRCSLGQQHGSVTCAPADGEPGGLLVIGEGPSRQEASAGRPFSSSAGLKVRALVDEHWEGPVAYTNALLCGPPPAAKKNDQVRKLVDACRGYLTQTIIDVQPTRVITMGSMATYAVLGRYPDPQSVSGGYGWLQRPARPSAGYVPVVILPSMSRVVANRFLRHRLEVDLAEALQRGSMGYGDPPWWRNYDAALVCSAWDAERVADMSRTEWGPVWKDYPPGTIVVDVESAGHLYEPELFRLLSVGIRPRLDARDRAVADVFVWTKEALRDMQAVAHLAGILDRHEVVCQGGKFDLGALRCALAINVRRYGADTMLHRRLVDAGADADLGLLAEFVGMGGHKEEEHASVSAAVTAVRATVALARSPEPPMPAPLQSGKPSVAKLRARETKIALIAAARYDVENLDPIVVAGVERSWDAAKFGNLLIDPDVLYRYNARDVMATALVAPIVEQRLKAEPDIEAVWNDVVCRTTKAFQRIEEWGVACDRDAVARFSLWLDVQQADVLRRVRAYGITADLGSWQQVGKLLFEQLKLPVQTRTASGGYGTDEFVLEKLRGKHPVVDDILAHRKLVKMRGTYADGGDRDDPDAPFELGRKGLLQWVCSDGRIHLNYNITGAESGRPSADQPNLLNQPRAETEAGKMVRDAYVAPPGRVLYEFDRSQIEVRVLAAISQDPDLRQVFVQGRDIYLETAKYIAHVFKKRPEEITKEGVERQYTKAVVLSIAYQKGAKQLAEDLGVSVKSAESIMAAVLGRYRKLDALVREQKRNVILTGQSWTTWKGRPARRRWLTDAGWQGDDYSSKRAAAERAAVNHPAQGGASEYTLESVCDVVDWIEEEQIDAKLTLTVYDSIMLEVADNPSTRREVEHVVPAIMVKTPLGFDVPHKIDCKRGYAWGSLKTL